jgi:ribosomal protein S18 acetylase RimI-like enzyme
MTHAAPAAGSLELARRIQASIRSDACRARDVQSIGPFIATFYPADRNTFLNYAIPEEAAEPTRRDVEALIAAYRTRDRAPRLEYLPILAPAVERALVGAGFAVEGRLPLLTAASVAALVPTEVAGIQLVSPSTEDDFRAVASVQWEAYEEQGAVPRRVIDSLRRSTEKGGIVVLARTVSTGEPAGAGQCTIPHEGLTELTSVGVRDLFRQRGIAQALAARIASDAFASGATGVFLMARGEPEARIYERAGFAREGEVLHVSLMDEPR